MARLDVHALDEETRELFRQQLEAVAAASGATRDDVEQAVANAIEAGRLPPVEQLPSLQSASKGYHPSPDEVRRYDGSINTVDWVSNGDPSVRDEHQQLMGMPVEAREATERRAEVVQRFREQLDRAQEQMRTAGVAMGQAAGRAFLPLQRLRGGFQMTSDDPGDGAMREPVEEQSWQERWDEAAEEPDRVTLKRTRVQVSYKRAEREIILDDDD